MMLSSRGRGGFTLIELLVVILIIGVLVAVSAPSFLGQTQKANDSAAKQELAVAYREAKAVATDHDGDFTATGFDVSALASQIQAGEPELVVQTGSCPDAAAGQPYNNVYVDPTGTTGDSLELCADPNSTVWTLTVVNGGPPVFSSTSVSTDTTTTTTTTTPVVHKMVFECAGSQALCTMNDDGSDEAEVPGTMSGDTFPVLSPDETTIAFIRGSDVYTVKPDGSDLTRVTIIGNISGVAWSPDGSQMAIAYYDASTSHKQIFLIDSDGGGCCRVLTDTSSGDNFSPSWEGNKIAFLSSRAGAPSVYVMNDDGSDQTQVTTDGDFYYGVSLSPDASKVAVMDVSGVPEVYVLPLSGSSKTAVTSLSSGAYDPTWSPDGSKIAFEANDSNFVRQIATANPDGSDFTFLTSDIQNNILPNWR